jgi:lambda repressor-like predicted transcriptional regulator
MNPEIIWNDVMSTVQKTGNITEYNPEIIKAMKKYAGLCMNQLFEEDRIKSSNLAEYMELRSKIDMLIHSQI